MWQSWMSYGCQPPHSPHLPGTLSAKETRHRQKIQWTAAYMGMTFLPVDCWVMCWSILICNTCYVSGEENADYVIEWYIWNVWRCLFIPTKTEDHEGHWRVQYHNVSVTNWVSASVSSPGPVLLNCHTIMANWELNRAPLFLWHYQLSL